MQEMFSLFVDNMIHAKVKVYIKYLFGYKLKLHCPPVILTTSICQLWPNYLPSTMCIFTIFWWKRLCYI